MAAITDSIGTTGRDFSTITLWEASLSAHAGDDLTGEMFNDSVFDETVIFNDATPTSTKLTVPSTERHDSTAGSGVRIVRTGTGVIFQNTIAMDLEWVEFDCGGQDVNEIIQQGNDGTFRNLIVHDSASTTTAKGIGLSTIGSNKKVLNCTIYDVISSSAGADGVIGLDARAGTGDTVNVSNCTVFNATNNNGSGSTIGLHFLDEAAVTIQNCIAMDSAGSTSGSKADYGVSAPATATVDHNMASDDTDSGTGSIGADDGVLTANQFVSTTGGSEDLTLKEGSEARDAGVDLVTTPTNVNISIENRDRDALADNWDMGSSESVLTITKSIGTTGRDNSTITLWEADLDSTPTIYAKNDIAIGEMFNDSAFDEIVTFNGGGTVGLASTKLTVPVSERGDATAGTGVRNVLTSAGTVFTFSTNLVLSQTLDWMEIDMSDLDSGAGVLTDIGGGWTLNLNHLIIHNALKDTASGNMFGISIDNNHFANIMNSIIYRLIRTTDVDRNVSGVEMIEVATREQRVLNVTIHNIVNDNNVGDAFGVNFSDDAQIEIKNTIVTDVTGTASGTIQDYSNAAPANAVTNNNMSSDGSSSGSGSLDNGVANDIYISTTVGSEDFHLKSGAAVDPIDAGEDLGTSPTDVNFDIDNRDRDAQGDIWDMGADEFVAGFGSVVNRRSRLTSLIGGGLV